MFTQNKTNGGSNEHLPLSVLIEGREFEWPHQFISGKDLREMAGLPPEADLYLAVPDPWDDEKVPIDGSVDLAREGIEGFYVRKPLVLIIDDNKYDWKKQYISKVELCKLAGVSAEEDVFLLLEKPYDDERLDENSVVNLARPGIEHFRVKKKGDDIKVSIRINDKPFETTRGTHSVADIKKLGGVKLSDELSELINGKLVPLPDNGNTLIKGGEEFFSCKREGASS